MFDTLIVKPLGYILGFIYQFVGNYGWSLVIFTVLVKILLLPLGLKQQKATVKMQQVQPKMKEIQEKYANDQQKLSEETMKLYKEYGVNPMGGCLPLLIQLPILYGLYNVIYKPITYMLHQGHMINKYLDTATTTIDTASRQMEISLAKAQVPELINFNFLGLDLSATPNITDPNPIWLVPILAAVTTYLSSKITTMMNGSKKENNEQEKKPQRVLSPDQKTSKSSSADSMTKSMSIMMPLMTLWITFTFPATIGVYWTISNVASLLQTVLLNGYYKNKMQTEVAEKSAAIAQQKAEKKARYNHKKR